MSGGKQRVLEVFLLGFLLFVGSREVAFGATYHEVQKGESLWSIARRYKVPLRQLFELNGLSEDSVLQPGMKILIEGERDTESGNLVYTVKQGDTPWGIAREFQIPVRLLLEANGLTEKSILQIGQRLVIPLSGKAPSGNVAAEKSSGQRIHVVRAGDSLWRISRQYGVSVQSLMQANNLTEKSILQVGMRLVVPQGSGKVSPGVERASSWGSYTVQKGDTLWSISRRFGVPLQELLKANGLRETSVLQIGQVLRVPSRGGSASSPSRGTGGLFLWPVSGRISSRFGPRGRGFHYGVDIIAPSGTPVRAVDDGVVSYSGWMSGYGRVVIITHASGLQTVYAHNSVNLVREGQRVRRGDVIARVGSTGNATCPHLHFEVRRGGRPVDPLEFLRR